MDIGGITPPTSLDAAVAAWVEAVIADGVAEALAPAGADAVAPTVAPAGGSLLAQAGFADRMLGDVAVAPTTQPSHEPDPRADDRAETATLQTFARPQVTAADAPPRGDAALPVATNALSEFALPAAQLVPSTLIGLQVEAPWTRPLPHPAGAAAPQATDDTHKPPSLPAFIDEPPDDSGEDAQAQEPDEVPDTLEADVVAEAPDDEGCATLIGTLQAALAAAVPAPALLAAAEQWRRGRCIVLACPRGDAAQGPAWAFVLWPRRAATAWRRIGNDPTRPLSLFGRRVDARLQWSRLPAGERWCHLRMVKEHHPRRGRQLVAVEAGGVTGAPVACEVQLGPVLTGSRRPCEVALRINGVRRFWSALGGQWSVLVVVCSLPLAGRTTATMEEMPC